MVLTFATIYLSGWVVTTIAIFLATRRLTDSGNTSRSNVGLSIAGGAVWPLLVVGAVEFSSLAVYSAATSLRSTRAVPDSWIGKDAFDSVVVPLR